MSRPPRSHTQLPPRRDRLTSAANHASVGFGGAVPRPSVDSYSNGTQRQQCRHGPVVAPATLETGSRVRRAGRRRRGRFCHVRRGRRRQRAELAARPQEHRTPGRATTSCRGWSRRAIVVLLVSSSPGCGPAKQRCRRPSAARFRRNSHACKSHSESRNWTTTSSSVATGRSDRPSRSRSTTRIPEWSSSNSRWNSRTGA